MKIKKTWMFFIVILFSTMFLWTVMTFFKNLRTPSGSSPCSEPPEPPSCYFGRTHDVVLNGEKFTFYDSYFSTSVSGQVRNFEKDEYNLSKVDFKPGDVIIDIGANVGVFAIPLARRFPFLKIYSYEPVPEINEYFRRNMRINNISEGVITLVHKAVTGNGRDVRMMIDPNSWGSRMEDIQNMSFLQLDEQVIKSDSVVDIFKKYEIEKCKLFKIDCEGCEFEAILNMSDEVFGKIELFRGEFHRFNKLAFRGPGYTNCQLYNLVKSKGLKEVQVTFWGGKGGEKC